MSYNFLKQRQLNVSTKKRLNGNDNTANVRFELNYQMKEFDRLGCIRIEIDKKWYTIDSSIPTFVIEETTTGPTVTPYTVNLFTQGCSSIAKGVVTGTDFATIVKTALDAATSNTYTVTLDPSNYKLIVTGPASTTLRFLTNNDLIARYLGLSSNGYSEKRANDGTYKYESASIAAATATRLNGSIDLQRYKEIYVRSSMARGNWDSLMMTVYPSNTAFGGTLTAETYDVIANSVSMDTGNLNPEFMLMGDDGKLVAMNGGDWHMELLCFKDHGNTY